MSVFAQRVDTNKVRTAVVPSILKKDVTVVKIAPVYDTIIRNSCYTSYYSFSERNPALVTYLLYRGGGDISRKGMNFRDEKLNTSKFATNADYSGTGYDKGHMANAADFSNDKNRLLSTFKFYNCVPQAPGLNRGAWEIYEGRIRNASMKDSLFIVCYNHFSSVKMHDRVSIPDTCYKIVYVIKDGVRTYDKELSACFTNTQSAEPMDIPKSKLDYVMDIINTKKKK